jgi:hypothetical protein
MYADAHREGIEGMTDFGLARAGQPYLCSIQEQVARLDIAVQMIVLMGEVQGPSGLNSKLRDPAKVTCLR